MMEKELLEQMAEKVHDGWWEEKKKQKEEREKL